MYVVFSTELNCMRYVCVQIVSIMQALYLPSPCVLRAHTHTFCGAVQHARTRTARGTMSLPTLTSALATHCAASTDNEVVTRWDWTLGYMRVANDSVAVSHGLSERQLQLADTVHALNAHVFITACKLVRQLCTAPGGASHALQAPVSLMKDWRRLTSD